MEPINGSIQYLVHFEELLGVLREVQLDARRLPLLRRFPTRYSPSVLADLRGMSVERHDVGHSIRQIHDFYGWMAKLGAKRGHCAGALYRTLGYMAIPRDQRNGTKQSARNIHIEHTVPVGVLVKALRAHLADFESPSAMHRFLIGHSVCVAFSSDEEVWLGEAKIPPSTNQAFDEQGRVVHHFPFRRYARLLDHAKTRGREFRIINVVTGEEVCLEQFSFAQHVESLAMASRLVAGPDCPSLYDLELFGGPA